MEQETMRMAACQIESSTRRNATTLEDIKGKDIQVDKSNELQNENNKKNTTPECPKRLSIAETVLMELEKAMGCKFVPKVKGILTAKTQTKPIKKTKKGGNSFTKEPRKMTEICFGTERKIIERYLATKAKTVGTERENLPDRNSSFLTYGHDHEKCIEERKRNERGWDLEEGEEVEWEEEDPPRDRWLRYESPTPSSSEDEDDTQMQNVMPKDDLDDVMVV